MLLYEGECLDCACARVHVRVCACACVRAGVHGVRVRVRIKCLTCVRVCCVIPPKRKNEASENRAPQIRSWDVAHSM